MSSSHPLCDLLRSELEQDVSWGRKRWRKAHKPQDTHITTSVTKPCSQSGQMGATRGRQVSILWSGSLSLSSVFY